jgi:hypothetical protein
MCTSIHSIISIQFKSWCFFLDLSINVSMFLRYYETFVWTSRHPLCCCPRKVLFCDLRLISCQAESWFKVMMAMAFCSYWRNACFRLLERCHVLCWTTAWFTFFVLPRWWEMSNVFNEKVLEAYFTTVTGMFLVSNKTVHTSGRAHLFFCFRKTAVS